MYRKAIAKKKKGALIASIAIGIFTLVSIGIAMKYPVGWAIFGFSALFAGLMVFATVQNAKNIRKMEMNYPGSLELDVDNCDDENVVAGKYFFLTTHLVDPFNARMIKYDDIKSVKAIESYDGRREVKATRESRIVNIRTKTMNPNSTPILFNDFCDGMARSDKETVANYEKFMQLIDSRVGEDTEVTIAQL